MNQYFGSLDRLDKRAARKAFNNGAEVMFIPCNCNPENKFNNLGAWFNSDDAYYGFDSLVNAFEFYNCNPETGRYAAFYVRKVV